MPSHEQPNDKHSLTDPRYFSVVSFSNLWYQPKISQLSYVYQTIPVKCFNLLMLTIDLERTTTEITEYEKHAVFSSEAAPDLITYSRV